MHLIEILLPVTDNDGRPFRAEQYARIREELPERFGGITAFSRAPAHGSVREENRIVHDDILVYEVMTDRLERSWWSEYRRKLEEEFAQDSIVIRASEIVRL